jgi:hypothetical protein
MVYILHSHELSALGCIWDEMKEKNFTSKLLGLMNELIGKLPVALMSLFNHKNGRGRLFCAMIGEFRRGSLAFQSFHIYLTTHIFSPKAFFASFFLCLPAPFAG